MTRLPWLAFFLLGTRMVAAAVPSIVAPAPAETFRNRAWPEDVETAFLERAAHTIAYFAAPTTVNLTNEYEKGSLPKVMFNYLAGHQEHALQEFVRLDEEQAVTEGIDYYWCFTLKGQIRKMLLWKDLLPADYLARCKRAAALWLADDPRPTMELVHALRDPDPEVQQTALRLLQAMRAPDPLALAERVTNEHAAAALRDYARTDLAGTLPGLDVDAWTRWWSFFAERDWTVFEEVERVSNPRPHPVLGVGSGPVGTVWGPEVRGGWVDARNTDNLRAMRETSVYLVAEAFGHEQVRKLYKQKLRRFVTDLYQVGMGEWDSETYLAHTTVPYLNLYDFARDPEVKLLAKAALDWLSTSMAWKYYRGGFAPPSKRDYGGACKVFGAGASHLAYLWFGGPVPDPAPHYDDVHAITSTYRPPLAVWHLANKNFRRPVEVLATKPTYQLFLPGKDQAPAYFETVYYGTSFYLGSLASPGADGDTSPFALMAENPTRGVDFVMAAPGLSYNRKEAGAQIGQYGNLLLYVSDRAKEWSWQLPKSAQVREEGAVWFVKLDATFLAIWPIGLQPWAEGANPRHKSLDRDLDTIRIAPAEAGLTGFGMLADDGTDFDAFRREVLAHARLQADSGEAWTLTAPDGRRLYLAYNHESDLPVVRRDGILREYHIYDQWRPSQPQGPLEAGWKQGRLTVRAGGEVFVSEVGRDGQVRFTESRAP